MNYSSELPSKQKMYQMIQFLFEENKKLHKEIDKIKIHCRKNKKHDISEFLNDERNKCKILWKDYNDNIRREHLQELFENTRISCIKKIISDNLKQIPIRSFSEKRNILYVFGMNEEEWSIFTEKDFQNWMNNIKSKLLGEFLKWKEEMEIKEKDSESFIDRSIYYMTKVGTSKNEQKEHRELYKWLCEKTENNI